MGKIDKIIFMIIYLLPEIITAPIFVLFVPRNTPTLIIWSILYALCLIIFTLLIHRLLTGIHKRKLRKAIVDLSVLLIQDSLLTEGMVLRVIDTSDEDILTELKIDKFLDVSRPDIDDPQNTEYRIMNDRIQDSLNRLKFPKEKIEKEKGKASLRAAEYYSESFISFEKSAGKQFPTSYSRRNYYYENDEWKEKKKKWFHYLSYIPDRTQVNLEFADLYFDAFWWWGCYCEYPFCEEVLKTWEEESKRTGSEWLSLVKSFHESYPYHHSYPDGNDGRDNKRWSEVRTALEKIRQLGGLEGTKTDKKRRHVKALTNLLLAESFRYQVNPEYRNAEKLFLESKKLFEKASDANDLWNIPWCTWELGDLYLEQRLFVEASRRCYESIEGGKKQDDNEIIANAYRTLADIAWRQDKYEEALKHFNFAVYYAYLFQAYPDSTDFYSKEFYCEMIKRMRNALQGAWNKSELEKTYNYLLGFWENYWNNVKVKPEDYHSLIVDSANNSPDFVKGLLPPAPDLDDRENLEEYMNLVQKFRRSREG